MGFLSLHLKLIEREISTIFFFKFSHDFLQIFLFFHMIACFGGSWCPFILLSIEVKIKRLVA